MTRDSSAGAYKPHVTVAYSAVDRNVPVEVDTAIDSPTDEVGVTVRDVTLLEINRDHRMYEWAHSRKLALADPVPQPIRRLTTRR